MDREIHVEEYLVKRVEKDLGGQCWKINPIGRTGRLDQLVILPNWWPFFCELKRPKDGRVSRKQILQRASLEEIGQTVYICKNEAEIDEMLETELNRRNAWADVRQKISTPPTPN